MASVGPNSPGTVVDDSAVGTRTWSNPDYAKANDGSYASASALNSTYYTHYLKATNFGFSIPSGATIDGIKVEIDRMRGSQANTYDYVIKLVIDGSVTGSNYAGTSTNWPTSDAYATYGGSSDKWGLTPTATQINSSDFGMVLQVKLVGTRDYWSYAYVDHIRITVYYTEGSTAHELTAQAITSGTPTIGNPTIAEKHALTSKTIEAGVPAVAKTTLGQIHALTSKAITSGIPAIQKAIATHVAGTDELTAKNITSGVPAISKPTLKQIYRRAYIEELPVAVDEDEEEIIMYIMGYML